MGWEDRSYYRDRSGAAAHPILRALNGSVPLFTAFGIRVRAHAILLLFIAFELLFDVRTPLDIRVISMAVLGVIIIIHEFGHCFAARSVGGSARDILLWPLGGLAMADHPNRPWPAFFTAAGGPLINVGICIISAVAVYFLTPIASEPQGAGHFIVSLNPFSMIWPHGNLATPAIYAYWFYYLSYLLLVFNLLPIYPLDGGQMFQAILWHFVGMLRSMNITTIVGYIGGGAMILLGLFHQLNFLLIGIGLFVILSCRQARRTLVESGIEPWSDANHGIDYSAGLFNPDAQKPKRRKGNQRALIRARKIAQQEAASRSRIDQILAKVSASGMHSLNWAERRTLRKASERQRRGEEELSRYK